MGSITNIDLVPIHDSSCARAGSIYRYSITAYCFRTVAGLFKSPDIAEIGCPLRKAESGNGYCCIRTAAGPSHNIRVSWRGADSILIFIQSPVAVIHCGPVQTQNIDRRLPVQVYSIAAIQWFINYWADLIYDNTIADSDDTAVPNQICRPYRYIIGDTAQKFKIIP